MDSFGSIMCCSSFQQCLPSHPTKVEVVEPQYKTVYHSETRPSVPYSGATNFYAAMNGSEKYGHMTTFELLSGTTSSTPIKFSKLNSGSYGEAVAVVCWTLFC